MVSDLRIIQSEALKYLTKIPNNCLKNEFLKFLVINFAPQYFSFIEKSKIQENKLAERITQEEVQNITHSLAVSFNKLHKGLLELEEKEEEKEDKGTADLDTDDQSIFRMQF